MSISVESGAIGAIGRLHGGKRMSEVAIFQNTVYLAGQVAEDTTLDIVGQTKDVLSQIDRLLAEAGSDKSRILRCQIFLSDIQNFDGMNLAWDAWVAQDNAPPRATVEAKLAKSAWLVEMVVTAAQA
jgi:enamine deaminase RidA (YjgF/YER057c/UK114 family)